MSVRILQGDCREVMASLPDCSVDAIVTDPPYELTSGKKGGTGAASVNLESPYGRARIGTGNGAGGFMGMKWDATGVAFDPETWRQALRVLKPGGYLLAFSGTRTYHRMAVAIEDAGFEVRDQIGWLYGSGFPKSHNGEWGGTALKPAWEPICMARKPLQGTVEANWRKHGTGALNIDGCRVMFQGDDDRASAMPGGKTTAASGNLAGKAQGGAERFEFHAEQGAGRWPANVLHDGSDEVVAAFPAKAGGSAPVKGTEDSTPATNVYGTFKRVAGAFHADTGSAARFFWSPKASRADRNEGLGGGMAPAVGTGATMRDREDADWKARNGNHHPTVKPTDLMRYLCRLVTPPGGVVLDPFMGSGSTLKAAELEGFSAIGIELSTEYIAIAQRRIAADAPLFADVEVQA